MAAGTGCRDCSVGPGVEQVQLSGVELQQLVVVGLGSLTLGLEGWKNYCRKPYELGRSGTAVAVGVCDDRGG